MKTLLLAAALVFLATPTSEVCATSGCGLEPLKPLTPLGCDDLVLRCVCDAKGRNCQWQWVCVKKD